MPDIFMPPQLSEIESGLKLLNVLKDINDPEFKKKIEQNIKSFYILNESESAKYKEAKDLINQASSIMREAEKASKKTKDEADLLEQERTNFRTEIQSKSAEIAEQRKKVDEDLVMAASLHEKAKFLSDNFDTREKKIREDQNTHAENLKKLEADKLKLIQDQKDLENLKNEEMSQINARKEALKTLASFYK